MSRKRRTRYIVKGNFQWRFVFHIYALFLTGALLAIFFFSITYAEVLSMIYDSYGITAAGSPFYMVLRMLAVNWHVLLLTLVIITIVAISLSHRVAGPHHKFEKILDRMKKGVIDPDFNIRANDEGQELCEKLRGCNLYLADKISSLKEITSRLCLVLGTMSENPGTVAPADIQHLKESVAEMQIVLDKFEVRK